MIHSRLWRSMAVALLLLAMMAVPAWAQSDSPGKLVIGNNYVLAAGQTLNGDLGVVGGSAIIEPGAAVNGDVMVVGGTFTVSGRINGDVGVFGGKVNLLDGAIISGDVVTYGGNVERSAQAVIQGQMTDADNMDGGPQVLPFGWNITPNSMQPPQRSAGDWVLHTILSIIRALVLIVAMTALAALLGLVWPGGLQRMGNTLRVQPLTAFLVGMLTWIIGIGLIVVMSLTICLIPMALVLALVLLVAALLSWVVVGWLVGQKLLALLNVRHPNMLLEAAVGTFVLMSVYFLVSVVGCFAFVFGAIVASFGAGVLVLTRFGTQLYPLPIAGTANNDYSVQIAGELPPAPPSASVE